VSRLFARGPDAILKKVGEEATEAVMAAKDGDRLRIVGETADLWFHCLIMLAQYGLRPADVLAELRRREGISGIDEKAARADKRRARRSGNSDGRASLRLLQDRPGEIPCRKIYEDADIFASMTSIRSPRCIS